MNQDERAELHALITRVDRAKPRAADLQAFDGLLQTLPDAWRAVGDLAVQIEVQLVQSTDAPESWRRSVEHGLHVQRRELGYSTASPLERMLIDQVVLCWLRHYLAEYHYSAQLNASGLSATTLAERTLTLSQARYLKAIEALARVRRLRVGPASQVNIATAGGQQVNLIGGASDEITNATHDESGGPTV